MTGLVACSKVPGVDSLPLTGATICNVNPVDKSIKLTDGGGIYLEVRPIGAKPWREDCLRIVGKKKPQTR